MVFYPTELVVRARPKVHGGYEMESQLTRLPVGSIGTVGIYVEPMAKNVVSDGPHILETVSLRVVTEEGYHFSTDDLERMCLEKNDLGAREIGMLCSRRPERMFVEYFSKGMPYTQGRLLVLCARVEQTGAVRVTLTISCHSSAQG
jgi:hypothetical protein